MSLPTNIVTCSDQSDRANTREPQYFLTLPCPWPLPSHTRDQHKETTKALLSPDSFRPSIGPHPQPCTWRAALALGQAMSPPLESTQSRRGQVFPSNPQGTQWVCNCPARSTKQTLMSNKCQKQTFEGLTTVIELAWHGSGTVSCELADATCLVWVSPAPQSGSGRSAFWGLGQCDFPSPVSDGQMPVI